jgi:hypothetical protein
VYALMLVGLLILFFLPRYWLLLAFVIVTAAISGLALHDAWIGAQSLRTTAGQPLLPNELFWQSRSLWEALVRQSVFVVSGGALVAVRKMTLAGRSQAAGHKTAQTTNVERTTPDKLSEDLPPPTPRTGPSDLLSSSDATSPPAGFNWWQGLRRVFLVLSVIWWCAALIVTLPETMAGFPDRSWLERQEAERCNDRLSRDEAYLAWRSAEPPIPWDLEDIPDDLWAQWQEWGSRSPCHGHVLSAAVQQDIDVAHRRNLEEWTNSLVLLLGFIAIAPFAAAAVLIAGWRVYRWTLDGFNQ